MATPDSTAHQAHADRPPAVSAPQSHSERHGIIPAPSHGIDIRLPPAATTSQPPAPHERMHHLRHMSAPAYQSPIRHHKRTPSRSGAVKETLNARSHYGSSDDDGSAVHRINQYVIKQEIGRGSFGAVHLAVDQYGTEFAVKEFSKSRLRKRAQSNLLRQGKDQRRRPGHLAAGVGFNSPLHRMSSQDRLVKDENNNNSLHLIKEEIAVMKKLNHSNLVSLIEVLDDPEEDSLYMVLELCKKGVVMKVGLDARAEPYEEEACRCWFRDMILGIEYLHAQGVVHRDIKPDNCLITDDDVLKIVDFGVSEMFEKASDMATAKSAGSPAFMPPELCVAKHGQVSGRAADIWSMGVTLYCLRYGHIPFEKTGMLELYDSIRGDELLLEDEKDASFEDLIKRLLEKDPEKRITMEELREHPWITRSGTDPLLPADENCSDLVDPPTEAEMNHAITGNMGNLMVVMRAVKRFKTLLTRRRPHLMDGIFGRDSRIVPPPGFLDSGDDKVKLGASRSVDAHDRRPVEQALATEGVHKYIKVDDDLERLPRGMDHLVKISTPPDDALKSDHSGPTRSSAQESHDDRPVSNPKEHRPVKRSFTFPEEDHAKGHAHNPLLDTIFLDLGPDSDFAETHTPNQHSIVSESPPAVEMNIYELAYQDEMKRISEAKGESAPMYLNRRVDHREDLRKSANILDRPMELAGKAADKLGLFAGAAHVKKGGLAGLVKQAKEKKDRAGSDASADAGAQVESSADADAGADAQADKREEPATNPSSTTDGTEPEVRKRDPNLISRLRESAAVRESIPLNIPGSFPKNNDPPEGEPRQRDPNLISRIRDAASSRQSLGINLPGKFPKTPDADVSRPLE